MSNLMDAPIPKESELVVNMQHQEIDIDEIDNISDIPHVVTNHIRPYDVHDFLFYYKADNWEPVTISFFPELWTSKLHCYHRIIDYCNPRCIDYYFCWERGDQGNLHIHGIFSFESYKKKRAFQSWVNRYLGKFKLGTKFLDEETDEVNLLNLKGWYDYIHKQQFPPPLEN